MGLKGCGGFMKYSMFLFNALVLVAGCGLLGFGVYTKTNQTGVTAKFSSILGSNLLPTIALAFIISGAVVIFLSFLGCCGAIKEVRCMLVAYFLLLLLMLIGLITGSILIYAFRQKIEDMALTELRQQLALSYGKEEGITQGWDSMQKLFKCCGVEGDTQSQDSWAFYKQRSNWFLNQTAAFVPSSCCKDPDNTPNLNKCQGHADKKIMPARGPPVLPEEENDQIYTEGCYTAFHKMITDNLKILIGIGAGVAVVMILGMTFAICVCRRIKEDYYECD